MKARCLLAVLGSLAAFGCTGDQGAVETVSVVLRARPGSDIDVARVDFTPAYAVRRVFRGPNELELQVDRGVSRLGFTGPGLCPASVALGSVAVGARTEVELRPLFEANAGDAAEVGFDAPFVVTLTPGCREALAGKVEWSQIEGPPVAIHAEQKGLVLRGRTRPLADSRPGEAPLGLIAFSPRTRGVYVFRASFRGVDLTSELDVRIASAARASGLPSIPLGTRAYLGGAGWQVESRPRDGHAEVVGSGPIATFRPDARGRWLLRDDAQHELAVVAGLHSETPLDCGRSECHAAEADAALGSPMTSVLARGLGGAFPDYDPSCAAGCHDAGEPGLADGGFDAMRRELGLSSHLQVGPGAWDALPRALRRVGGVTCTACHGPGAIPEPRARWAVLRSDVCAVCHDAPPRYGHVVAWSRTRMAKSDLDGDARQKAGCRGCHTTQGFLEREGVRKPDPFAPDVPLGISCAACHAPHGPHLGQTLVRDVPLPRGLSVPASAGPSRLCVACHSVEPGQAPSASAGNLVFGSAPNATAPHAGIGCTGCHGAGREHGDGHDFSVSKSACSGCHPKGVPPTPDLASRARSLLARLGVPEIGTRPAHAAPKPQEKSKERARALQDLLLVQEDPAAGVHNAAYARALLDDAESLLQGVRP